MIKFCIAESDLENYLFSNPLIFSTSQNQTPEVDINQSRSDKILYDAEFTFKEILTKSDKNVILKKNLKSLKLFK